MTSTCAAGMGGSWREGGRDQGASTNSMYQPEVFRPAHDETVPVAGLELVIYHSSFVEDGRITHLMLCHWKPFAHFTQGK